MSDPMFRQLQPERSALAKMATIFATVLVVSAGLCGVQFALLNAEIFKNANSLLLVVGFIELALIGISALGLAVILIIATVQFLLRLASRNRNEGPQ